MNPLKSLMSLAVKIARDVHHDRNALAIGAIAAVYAVHIAGPHIGVHRTLYWIVGCAAALAFIPPLIIRLSRAATTTRKENPR